MNDASMGHAQPELTRHRVIDNSASIDTGRVWNTIGENQFEFLISTADGLL